ncbi:UDP-N-acetylglucosamine transporter TMEM241 isoform X3 [Saimiri boliviensis]|uniref:UDP-N-acetylglucosamine transporter TMEM241 isoform X3 n=1 Tax=Saimiri boliviensis TaxID=27679 RepID=UPI003D7742B0
MCVRKPLVGLTFCTCYLASYLTNKYVLSVLKFTYPTLFQGSHVLAWLPAAVLFVGIIYAGSRALSRLAIPVFLTLHNVAEVIICGYQKCFRKEKTSPAKICSALFLLAAAGCLPFNDSQFDPDGYFWALIHLFCLGAYKILQKFQKPSALSDIDQQYLNYIFSVVLLAFASHPTGKRHPSVVLSVCLTWLIGPSEPVSQRHFTRECFCPAKGDCKGRKVPPVFKLPLIKQFIAQECILTPSCCLCFLPVWSQIYIQVHFLLSKVVPILPSSEIPFPSILNCSSFHSFIHSFIHSF